MLRLPFDPRCLGRYPAALGYANVCGHRVLPALFGEMRQYLERKLG
jgi:hypothetical protein